MKLIFEKDGKKIEVEQTSKNHMLQVADYVKNGYTFIGTDAPETADESKTESSSNEDQEQKVVKEKQKRILFAKANKIKSVGFGVATYLHIYIIAITLTYITDLLPRHVQRGPVGDMLGLAVLLISLYTLFKIIQNRQFKLIFINYLIIGIFIFAGLFFSEFISILVPFKDLYNMLIIFIVYVIQVTVIYDMANHVNLASMKELLKDGYEITNHEELTEDELNIINDKDYTKPFWQIVS